MLELLQFIFSSFWVWAGTVILLAVIARGFTLRIVSDRRLDDLLTPNQLQQIRKFFPDEEPRKSGK